MNTNWERNSSVHLQIVLQRAVKIINSKIGKDFKEKGITTSQFSVLDVLYTKGEMRICELIEKVLSTSGNITVVIKNMENRGWLYKTVSPEDKRAFLVRLTEEGMKLIDDIFPIHKKNTKRIFEKINDKELVILKETLKKIN